MHEPGTLSREFPVPPSERARVLLFGGTFDPVHAGHVELADRARRAAWGLGPEQAGAALPWLVFVPAGRSPFKDRGPVASGEDRAAMIRLAAEGRPRVAVWGEEVLRGEAGEASYWVRTLATAREACGPDADLRFLLGGDQLAGFHRWREPRRILELARPVVVARRGAERDAIADALRGARFWTDAEIGAWLGAIVDVGLVDAAATDVRERLRRGLGADGLLHPLVERYAVERRLYAADTEERGAPGGGSSDAVRAPGPNPVTGGPSGPCADS